MLEASRGHTINFPPSLFFPLRLSAVARNLDPEEVVRERKARQGRGIPSTSAPSLYFLVASWRLREKLKLTRALLAE